MLKYFKSNISNFIILSIFLLSSLTAFLITHRKFYLFDLPYIGFSIFIGLTLHNFLPKAKKQIGRLISQFLVGFYFMFFLAAFVKVNMQIEGFFFQILSLFFGGAFIHYAIAKIFGPLYFGRGFCGWACWNAMLFDLLPWKKSSGRIRFLGSVRYFHLAVVIIAVFVLYFKFNYSVTTGARASLQWFVVGNIFYFIVGIASASILKDNRSFCKYVCPIPPIQKIFSRFAVLKFRIDSQKCNECHACEKVCPMDIKILDYKHRDSRVRSTECILCNACSDTCPTKAISLSNSFDVCTHEFLKYRKSKSK